MTKSEERLSALVVGAGTPHNIGYATADVLAQAGWAVTTVDLHHDHSRWTQVTGDVTTADGARAGVEAVVEAHGHLDLIVNSAGVNILGTLTEYTEENWERTMAVNATSQWLLLREYLRACDGDGRRKRFIAITSDTAEIPKSASFAYGASKAAANQLIRSAARELNKYSGEQWLVTALALGRVLTPMDRVTIEDVAAARGLTHEEVDRMLSANIPLGRGMFPTEVGRWVEFVARHGQFATGNVLRIDAGQLQG